MRKRFIDLLAELGIEREKIRHWSNSKEYMQILTSVTENEKVVETIVRTAENYWKNFMDVVNKYGIEELERLSKDVRKIKEYSVDHMEELVDKACKNIEANRGRCYIAKDAEEARRIIGEIVGDARTVVKAKSMTSEEIYIREYLEDLGKDVFETDLGEFLVQVLGPKPMHLTSPALHIPREKVAELLRKMLNKEVDPNDIPRMVSLVREFLRKKFIEAEVGISGANVIAADPGYIFILENESNTRLVTSLPEKHIVIAGMEKVVPTLYDAVKVADVITKYAGYRAISYMNVIGGPSKTGDIEKKVVYGAHGPKELHVVFLDNGRVKASKDPILKEALYCLRCGACMYVCPVFKRCGGYWGGEVYMGGIGAIWTAITEGLEKAFPLPMSCLHDLGCMKQCPVKINQSKILFSLAVKYAKKGCS